MTDDLDVMEQRVRETQKSLADKIDELETKVSDTVQETTSAVAEAVTSTVESVQTKVEDVTDSVTDVVKRTFDVQHQIEQHPFVFLGASTLFGFVAGRFLFGPEESASDYEYSGRSATQTGPEEESWLSQVIGEGLESAKTAAIAAASSLGTELVNSVAEMMHPPHSQGMHDTGPLSQPPHQEPGYPGRTTAL